MSGYALRMGERIATGGPHVISCHVMRVGWSVTFIDVDYKTRIGPWLLCDTHEEVLKILAWGHVTAEDLAKHHCNIARWGVGGGNLHLSGRERHQLIARGHGCPWTGYDLRKMKEAGRYPPQRLTLAEEASYLRRRG
jgi:hypothetical protein